ncbi:MAG: hypothetical protein AAGL89_00805 [Pseudomonadota bacterium]
MTYEWVILGAIIVVSLLPLIRILRRMLFAFTIAFVGLMLIHMQHNPGEATLVLGALGAGLGVARPLRRAVFGGLL